MNGKLIIIASALLALLAVTRERQTARLGAHLDELKDVRKAELLEVALEQHPGGALLVSRTRGAKGQVTTVPGIPGTRSLTSWARRRGRPAPLLHRRVDGIH